MRRFATLAELSTLVGQPLAASTPVRVDQAMIDRFADCTGDRAWIHVDRERAAAGPFGSPIAHGFLTLSLLSQMIYSAFTVDDVVVGVNYGLNRVRFVAPVPVDSVLAARFKLLAFDPIERGAQLTIEATIERQGQSRPVCVAEQLVRQYTS